ncbi:hypothetical protein PIROE2DRAFT_6310 [Piromyces sp. E2]|nr:hypothetical protein PIROE2DRAFT_6310 [Piromyces sp. E2]|eukprot:OUM66472.1 hypothetical protein PIROE2DRAFT_6310 [Piromyces sp. E2]
METTLDSLIKAIQKGKINVVQKLIAINKNLVLEKYSRSIPFEDEDIGNEAKEMLGNDMTGMNAIQIGLMSLDIEDENVKVEVRKKIIEELIQALPQKIDLSTYKWGNDNTTLHLASFLGERSIINKILNKGEDPSYKNGLGKTSIDVAVDYELADYLNEVCEDRAEKRQQELKRKESLQNILKKCQNIEETIQHNKQEAEAKNKSEIEAMKNKSENEADTKKHNCEAMISLESDIIKKAYENYSPEDEKEEHNDIQSSNETIENDKTTNDETNPLVSEVENVSCNTINNSETSNEKLNSCEDTKIDEQKIDKNNEKGEFKSEDRSKLSNLIDMDMINNLIGTQTMFVDKTVSEKSDKPPKVEKEINNNKEVKNNEEDDLKNINIKSTINKINQINVKEENTPNEINDDIKSLKNKEFVSSKKNKFESTTNNFETNKIKDYNLSSTAFNNVKEKFSKNDNSIKPSELSKESESIKAEIMSQKNKSIKSIINNINNGNEGNDHLKKKPIIIGTKDSIKNTISNINKNNSFNEEGIKKREKNDTLEKDFNICQKENIKETISNINKNMAFTGETVKPKMNATLEKDINICQKENIKATISNINKNNSFNDHSNKSTSSSEKIENDFNKFSKERESIKATILNINKNNCFNKSASSSTESPKEAKSINNPKFNTIDDKKEIPSSNKTINELQNIPKKTIKETISNINNNKTFSKTQTSTAVSNELPKKSVLSTQNEQTKIKETLKSPKMDEKSENVSPLKKEAPQKENNPSNAIKKRDISKLIQAFNHTSDNESTPESTPIKINAVKEKTLIQEDRSDTSPIKSNVSALKSAFDHSESTTEKPSISLFNKKTINKSNDNAKENEINKVQKLSSKFMSNENQNKEEVNKIVENKELHSISSNISDKPPQITEKEEKKEKKEISHEIVKEEKSTTKEIIKEKEKEIKESNKLEKPNEKVEDKNQTNNDSNVKTKMQLKEEDIKKEVDSNNKKESDNKNENNEENIKLSTNNDDLDINKIINDTSVSGSDLTLNDSEEPNSKNSKDSKLETKSKLEDDYLSVSIN